jgi:hypothetical protein
MGFTAGACGARWIALALCFGGIVGINVAVTTRAMAPMPTMPTPTTMTSVAEKMHGNECHPQQYPNPVF